MFRKLVILLSLLFIGYQKLSFSATISFDQLSTSNDLTAAKYNTDLDRIYVKINSNVQTDNIANATLLEVDFADEINPRIRTFEGASCEVVVSGLLPATASGSLTSNISSGTAYPRGYRVNKSSTTSRTYTASRWTFVDIDQSGNFTFSEVTIDGSTPAVAVNSIRLARVSTDGTQVLAVRDLRTLNCAAASFDEIKVASTQASLGDLLKSGRIRTSADVGWIRGAQVSWDTYTNFIVRGGSSFFRQNAQYRAVSGDINVGQGNDDPTRGGSGLDTGSIAASTTYNIFLAAEEEGVVSYTVTYSAATTPSGVSNYRRIGSIRTNSASQFVSDDFITTHDIGQRELAGAWVSFNGGTAAMIPYASYNVSSITDNGVGDYTITWDNDFNSSSDYITVGMHKRNAGNGGYISYQANNGAVTAGSVRILTMDNNGAAAEDANPITIAAIGERP